MVRFKQSLYTAVVTEVDERITLVGDAEIFGVTLAPLPRTLGATESGGLPNREMDMRKVH